jgi:hypothetical protein
MKMKAVCAFSALLSLYPIASSADSITFQSFNTKALLDMPGLADLEFVGLALVYDVDHTYGTLEFGPATNVLLSKSRFVDGSGGTGTRYVYGPGRVTFDLAVEHPVTGLTGAGHFTAPLDGFTFDVPDDLVDEWLDLNFGRGVFDLAIARALGVSPHTTGGDWTLIFDLHYMEGEVAGQTQGLIEVQAPEPSTALLLLSGLGAILHARKARRRNGGPGAVSKG